MDGIAIEQEKQHNLRLLVAQRKLYSAAKAIHALHVIISVPAVIAWSAGALFDPEIKIYGVLWSSLSTLGDIVFLTPLIKDKKSKAAKFQEQFDCNVLALPWSECKLGAAPPIEAVVGEAGGVDVDSRAKKFSGWYPVAASKVPLAIGRLICQRANCWWDFEVRRRYRDATLLLLCACMLLVAGFSVAGRDTKLREFVGMVLLLQPSAVLLVRTLREQGDAASNAERLRSSTEKLWVRAITGKLTETECLHESRLIQNEIYDHRSRSPLVFDWVYERLRPAMERTLDAWAQELVCEYERAKESTHL